MIGSRDVEPQTCRRIVESGTLQSRSPPNPFRDAHQNVSELLADVCCIISISALVSPHDPFTRACHAPANSELLLEPTQYQIL